MEIHKGYVELMPYGKNIKTLSIIPIRIDVIDDYCEVEFITKNKVGFENHFIRKGKHQNFNFKTSIEKINLNINLRTGTIRRIREPRN